MKRVKKHMDLGTIALVALKNSFELSKKDLGTDERLSKRGMTFTTEAWDIAGVGHLCVMRMKGLAGLMRMETVIIAPTHVDMPLFNIDWIRAFGKETQIAELYNDQLQPWPDVCQAEFEQIRIQHNDIEDMQSEGHWYDDILYPCSCAKQGKGVTAQLSNIAQDYVASYVAQLSVFPACDCKRKAAKVRAFAERLYSEGGPAVKMVTQLFGQETAKRLIVQHMYGVKNETEE